LNEKILGLQKDIVLLSSHRNEWAKLYKEEEKLLWEAAGSFVIDIQHVGSTSVPGLISKPIIDIAIAVKTLTEGEKCIIPFTNLGYEYKLDKVTDDTVHHFFSKGGYYNRTHHIHLEEWNSKLWHNHILFRDYLRTHNDVINEYAKLKIQLAENFPYDRVSYRSGKNKFIESIIEKAKRNYIDIVMSGILPDIKKRSFFILL
jgi:GrpB-like predicted nucleotidyltransferase (UPF0157 family)